MNNFDPIQIHLNQDGIYPKKEFKKLDIVKGICLGIFLISAFIIWDKIIQNQNHLTQTLVPQLTTEQVHAQKIKSQFSILNGSHRKFTQIIKSKMKDPSSFEHVETAYWDNGNSIRVSTTFRGKNSFGATVLEEHRADFDLNGNLICLIK